MKFLFAYDIVSESLVVCQMVHNEAEFQRVCRDIEKTFPEHSQDLCIKYVVLPKFTELDASSGILEVKEFDFNG